MDSPIQRQELLLAAIDPEKAVNRVSLQEIRMESGATAPLHLHPCPTMGVVTEGEISFQIEGQTAQLLRAGDAFYEPAGVRVAKFDNDGSAPARFVVFYLLGSDDHETVEIL